MSPRKLDPFGGVALVVGSILGSGIFIAPSLIASFSGNLWIFAAIWIVGGLVCTAGALIYGGLGLMYPKGGGQYVYLRESMGPRYSRFYGWVSMLVICPTMLAGTSLFFTELCKSVVPSSAPYARGIALALLVFFTYLNTLGLRLAGGIQKFLVVLHVALFVGVVALAYWFLPNAQLPSWTAAPFTFSLSKMILAIAAVLWSFEGFNSITFITNEVEGGERNVRRIALWGCVVVLILYLIFNVVTLANVPSSVLVGQQNAAGYLMSQIFGARAAWIVFGLTVLGVATVLHSSIIIGPRLTAATVADGSVARSLAEKDARTGAPFRALWFQCAMAAFYVMVGHFDALITAFIVLNWLFYGLTAIGYMRVRLRSIPSLGRLVADFACVTLFCAMVAVLLLSQLLENTSIALVGFAAFVIGVYAPIPQLERRTAVRTADATIVQPERF